MSEISDPKKLLMDLAHELDGEEISENVEYKGFVFEMKLLKEHESNWRNQYVPMATKFAAITAWKLPTLAIAIRKINNIPVFSFFEEEWKATEESRKVIELVQGKGPYTVQYFAAEHLMGYLGERFGEGLDELYKRYEALEARREQAQGAVKKSSGENLVKEEKESGTEFSPTGEE